MIKYCSLKSSQKGNKELLEQAARELLLSQSSDWSFILRAGTTTDLAKDRIKLHLSRFWKLIQVLNGEGKISQELWEKFEEQDYIFPLIN